jgi:hypothetical protein
VQRVHLLSLFSVSSVGATSAAAAAGVLAASVSSVRVQAPGTHGSLQLLRWKLSAVRASHGALRERESGAVSMH